MPRRNSNAQKQRLSRAKKKRKAAGDTNTRLRNYARMQKIQYTPTTRPAV